MVLIKWINEKERVNMNIIRCREYLNYEQIFIPFELDDNLNFSKHVDSVSKSFHFHLRALHHIRSTPDLDAAKLISHAFVSSRLDYIVTLSSTALPSYPSSKLQRVQNRLTRVMLQKNSATPTAPLLK